MTHTHIYIKCLCWDQKPVCFRPRSQRRAAGRWPLWTLSTDSSSEPMLLACPEGKSQWFHGATGLPLYRWMVYVMENPTNTWMRTGGTPIETPFFSVSSHSVWILMDSHETKVSSLATQKSSISYKKVDRWNCIRIRIQKMTSIDQLSSCS